MQLPWHSWGPGSFAMAREFDRPVLLYLAAAGADGIFAEEAAAVRYLVADKFVGIRVNPFERPGLARRYAPDGWPALVALLPDGRMVARATDLPAANARMWLLRMADHFATRRDVLLNKVASAPDSESPRDLEVAEVYGAIAADFDAEHGGFGQAVKFPELVVLRFLLQYNRTTGERRSRQMLVDSLDALLRAPIWDSETGGLHTHSHTPDWTTPAHAKDGADQAALLLLLLSDELAATPRFRAAAGPLLHYVSSELYDAERGGFRARQVKVRGADGSWQWWTDPAIYAGRNAGFIIAFLRAAEVFGRRELRELAMRAADFALQFHVAEDGRVRHCPTKAGADCASGLLVDQMLVSRALALAGAGNPRFAAAARTTLEWAEEHLFNDRAQAFSEAPTAPAGEPAWVPRVLFADGMQPSGNAMAAELYLSVKRMDEARELLAGRRVSQVPGRSLAGIATAQLLYEQRVGVTE